jgi:hypothetical protein
MITNANTHSTLLSALKTILPIPNPKGRSMPGARNLSQASIKLMAHTNPIHKESANNELWAFLLRSYQWN